MLWWLSFVDPDKPEGESFLGVSIVDDRGEGMQSAVPASWFHGCNPGGEVCGTPCPNIIEPLVPTEYRNRLLTRQEARDLDDLIDRAREEVGLTDKILVSAMVKDGIFEVVKDGN